MHNMMLGALAAGMIASGAALAADGRDPAGFDLVFREGTLDSLPEAATLVYARDVAEGGRPGDPTGGAVELDLVGAATEGGEAVLRLVAGEARRAIGTFPAAVGNPVGMYFMESVVRDMAETSGGSPFYIRNRIKEALARPAEVQAVDATFDGTEVSARQLTLRPFTDDPNADRMRGFAALAVTVTMSDAVPGWYHSLSAEVPGPEGAAPLYDSRLTLREVETGDAQ